MMKDVLVFFIAAFLFVQKEAAACTRIVYKGPNGGVRTMRLDLKQYATFNGLSNSNFREAAPFRFMGI
ncbi:hypothetical protein A8C56_13210 [Niabella ginsenosidivorans]|uniref:Choloylglycine hydrolase/NAAA C-terminal domain-containing protein n=1 Tax=Niabella ginsenosidivorans TaxID=1176587 RepID=A0A1A9I539_9BACT|nr:hypothetical protein [Niabella ginsenosidivorans]ANH81810.1 hypothetical protein A8C56_13210 [Niabella ginsenosidivorans]